ncbi:MAG: transglutaminase domain-containing protein [Anaerolineae bacterium]|nr:transglutaminase domain-containing protein [Anaerolineae bacterium]
MHAVDLRTYYATPGPMTDPGEYSQLFDDLPGDIPALVKTIQGLMLHIFWAERYGVDLSDARKAEVQLRRVDQKLAKMLALDDRPLSVARPHDRKLVGNCRDFSVLMAAILRHQGVPARARCGFGTYFLPDHYEDHWVCEVWDAEEGRWILVDAQLDDLMCDVLQPDFDPLDVPHDRFIVGGKAWQLCRRGEVDPDAFGIFDMHGLWFVRGDLIRGFLAFSKVEILPWDGGWGYLAEGADEATGVMDTVAALTLAGDDAFDEIRALTEGDAGFRDICEAVVSGQAAGEEV